MQEFLQQENGGSTLAGSRQSQGWQQDSLLEASEDS